ncbi:Conserved domain protein [uncultured Candidatus Thioglobus sp.]|nr:Conserved domain protein [uncultured Candidatus Thioglobus sp.]
MDNPLKTLQQNFYQDVLNTDKAQDYLGNDDFSGNDLIKIYHNQYFISLKQALGNSYSCVKRLVGEGFFNSLASDFIKTHPSKTGSIIDYGSEFSEFIANDARCKTLPYLADVAKFEQLYERCYFSLEGKFFMHSSFPLIKIWQLDENSEQLDLSTGGDYLKIYKQGAKVVVERITEQQYKGKNEQTN